MHNKRGKNHQRVSQENKILWAQKPKVSCVIILQPKKAQFYLIAAIVIIAALIGFASIRNVAVTRNSAESIKLYDLSQELSLEGESVVNHGIFNDKDLNVLLDDFTISYGEYISDKENDVYFIYGDTDSVDVIGFVNVVQGSVGLNIGGGSPTSIPIEGNVVQRNETSIPNYELNPNVLVTVGDTTYPFEIKKGKNFFFIIRQPTGAGNTQIGVSNSEQ